MNISYVSLPNLSFINLFFQLFNFWNFLYLYVYTITLLYYVNYALNLHILFLFAFYFVS